MPTARELPDPIGFSQRLNVCLENFGYGARGGAKRLAEEFSVSAPVVSDWRKGRFLPSPAKVRTMAKQWRVPYDWLYWGEGRAPFSAGTAEARGTYAATPSAQDAAIDELRVVVSALVAVMAARRPAEAAALSAALKKTVAPEKMRAGLMAELVSVLDE